MKKILLSLVIILAVAAHVVGYLYIAKALTTKPAAPVVTGPQEPTTTVDLSKDYGACTILDKAFIQTTLGTAAASLQDPQNNGVIGRLSVGKGMDGLTYDAQSCVYGFAPGGTFENGFNSSNALNVVVTKYTNEGGPATFIEEIRNEPLIETIDGIGDDAFYSWNTSTTGPGATYTFKLQTFSDNTSVEYTIKQPAETATFKKDTAKAALITLAKQAQTKIEN